jgi:hypothetical protein
MKPMMPANLIPIHQAYMTQPLEQGLGQIREIVSS